jgi:hypothetical protein
LRDFVWQTAQCKGFRISNYEFTRYFAKQSCLGKRILFNQLPLFFRGSQIPFSDLLYDVAISYPRVFQKLPYLAAFGYTNGNIVHRMANYNETKIEDVSLASALFNMGIATFDHIVDELPAGDKMFRVLNPRCLLELMDLGRIESYYKTLLADEGHIDIMGKLFLYFAIAFFSKCKDIYGYNPQKAKWNALSKNIFKLYNAERLCYDINLNNVVRNSSNQLLKTVRCKSVMPFLIVYNISEMIRHNVSKLVDKRMKKICSLLGEILWISDDLADIEKDVRNGTPNFITIRLLNELKRRRKILNSEAYCEVIELAVENLVNLLKDLEDHIDSLSPPSNVRRDWENFVHMYVAAWIMKR